jgi:hypothetical protein
LFTWICCKLLWPSLLVNSLRNMVEEHSWCRAKELS